MRTTIDRLPLLLLPVALFLLLFGPATLDIGNIGWLLRGTDNGENALGLHAWLHDPAPGMLRTWLLGAPGGVPVLFTDSNPLLALVLRPVAAWLPADAQLIGAWLFACLFLQIGFAWALLRDHAPNQIALWCGVILLAMPPALLNRHVHVNLMAHWLILWALWRFVDTVRARSTPGWLLLIAVAALVHSYLLVMVGAVWASAVFARIAAPSDSADRIGALVGGVAALALVAAIAALHGAFDPHIIAGNYGAFAMPLDALWNPGTPVYSALMPWTEQRAGRGLEGFVFLGLGLLIAVPIAAVVAFRDGPSDADRTDLRRLGWLAPALVALTLLAVSNFPDFAGRALPRLPLPDAIIAALDGVRASGRLFWPVAYVIVLIILRILYRLPAAKAGTLIAALLLVQVADLIPMVATVRAAFSDARDPRRFVRTTDPRWPSIIAGSSDVAFVPGDVTRDLALFQEVAWRAVGSGIPVRNVYAARSTPAADARASQDTADFRAGRPAPGRLYVLFAGEQLPKALRARSTTIDGVTLVVPR